jgi:hypothetical protein
MFPIYTQLRVDVENAYIQGTFQSLKDPLEMSQRVRIFGLQSAVDLNGRECRVVFEDPNTQGRVGVQFADGQEVSVKGAKLERI